MPGGISVSDFLRETREDLSSPTTSNFVTRIPQCKETVNKLEEVLSSDRDGLVKFKTSIKEMNKTGTSHTSATQEFSRSLNRISESTFGREEEEDVGVAFQKFAIVTRQLSELMKDLMTSLDNIVMFPVDRLLKTELRGSKGDLKRPFDRAWKDYQDKYGDLERQKKKAAKEAGLHRSELVAGEIADEMEKERKYLQLTTSEYLLRINEIRTKKGVDLLQHLIKFYHAQHKYYSEGFQAVEHFGNYITELTGKLSDIRQIQDDEKNRSY
jgi:Arf-GAP/SH3 domain/ANK repeat/PH domain-containing protein